MFLPHPGASAIKPPWGVLTDSQLVQQRYHIDSKAVVYTNNADVTIYKTQFQRSMTTGQKENIYAKVIQRSKAGERTEYVVKQLKMVKAVKHPYIVQVQDVFLFPRWAFIFMEPLKGSLADELRLPTKTSSAQKVGESPTKSPSKGQVSPTKSSSKGHVSPQKSQSGTKLGPQKLTEDQAKVWFGEIADAIYYMHRVGWAHRDISPAAILVENPQRAALCSFGYVLHNVKGKLTESHVPTNMEFMSPERVAGAPYNAFASDVYSLGMVMFVSMSGSKLYESVDFDHVKAVHDKIPKLVDKSGLSADLKDLLKKMCDVRQEKRPLMKSVIKHPWFAKAAPGVKSVSPLAQWPNKDRGYHVKRALGNDWKNNETFPARIEAAGYRIEEKIGQGGFGSVYRGWKGKQPVAIKIIDVLHQSEEYKKKFKDRELEVLRHYDHPNICRIHDIYVERNRNSKEDPKEDANDGQKMNHRIFIFMELAKGDMEQLEKKQKDKKFNEFHARPLLLGAAKGVEYLHAKRVCHRDLKLPNILYKSKTHAVITDFSFAKETPHTVLSFTWIGTLAYQSPEIIAGDEKKGYNPYSADTWAYGCCMFLAITGSLPFKSTNKEQLKNIEQKKVIDVIREAKISDQARDLLFKTMKYDEKDRIPFHNIIKHEWFRCERFTYDTWPSTASDKPPDAATPVPPLQGV